MRLLPLLLTLLLGGCLSLSSSNPPPVAYHGGSTAGFDRRLPERHGAPC